MTATQQLAQHMSELSRNRTKESRQKAGALAWETRVKNLQAKLDRQNGKRVKKP